MLARQHVQEGLALVIGVIPKDVGPPVMLQPLSATARFMKIGVSSKKLSLDRPVDDRLLDDPAAAACRAGGGERRDLGRADQDVAGTGRPGAHA